MIIHIFYYAGRFLYSFTGNRSFKFITLDSLFVVICLTCISLSNSFLEKYFLNATSQNHELNKIFYSIIFFIVFFIPSLLSRFLSKSGPPEQAKISKEKESIIILPPGIKIIDKEKNKSQVTIGIIDFTWLFIMGMAYCGLIYCQEFEIFKNPILTGQNTEYYKLYYDEVKYLLGESINLALILGTILGVCMTIIWSGAIWRKSDIESIKNYKGTTLASMRMVLAFFIVVLSEIIWISVPLYLKLSSIKNFI